MIAYLIQVHSRLDHLARMIDWIYHPANEYFLSIDVRGLSVEQVAQVVPPRDNIHLFRSGPVTWGSERIFMAMMSGMEIALKLSRRWNFIVHTTESCFPLKPQEELIDFIADGARYGLYNYFNTSNNIEPEFLDDYEYTGDFEHILGTRPGVIIRSDVALHDFFTSSDASPIMSTIVRPGMHTLEVSPGIVHIRPLLPSERALRRNFYALHPYRIGRSSCVFSREVVEWMLTSTAALLCLEVTKSVFCPEEHYFQTALLSHDSPAHDKSVLHNLHFWDAGPFRLDDTMLEQLKQSDRFFARKLVTYPAPELVAWIDTLAYSTRAKRTPPPTSTAACFLMTPHRTVVGVSENGVLTQFPNSHECKSRFVKFALEGGKWTQIDGDALLAFDIRPAGAGFNLAKDGRFLCAIPHSSEVVADRESASVWETFFLVPEQRAGELSQMFRSVGAERSRLKHEIARLQRAGQAVQLFYRCGDSPRPDSLNLDDHIGAPGFALQNPCRYFLLPLAEGGIESLDIESESLDAVTLNGFYDASDRRLAWRFIADARRVLKAGARCRLNISAASLGTIFAEAICDTRPPGWPSAALRLLAVSAGYRDFSLTRTDEAGAEGHISIEFLK